jgi:hypothetical protein
MSMKGNDDNALPIEFNEKEDMTQQHFKDECDVNNILRKYVQTGNIEHFNVHGGSYMEVPAGDFHTAMNIVAEATQMFDQLPGQTRKEFNNDVETFLSQAPDEKYLGKMIELGLAERPEGWKPAEPAPEENPAPPPKEAKTGPTE